MITATRIGGSRLPTGTRACTRCGIVREVKASARDWCRDCRDVEALATREGWTA